MTTCGHEHEDAAYVLGALSPEDRVAFERHLPGCPECARSVAELAGLPGLLARVPVEVIDPEEPPLPVPDTLLPGLVRRVRETQRRRTWLTGAMVGTAAAVAAVAVGFATVGHGGGNDQEVTPSITSTAPTTAAPQVMQPVGSEPMTGWLSLTQVGWGTRLDLTCTYEEQSDIWEHPDWSTYAMYVHTADGKVERVASWKALPGKTMHLTAATAATRAQITEVEVRTADNEPVLTLAV
jgi:hypothetical protein